MDMAWLSKRRTRWQNSNNAGTSKRDKIFSGYSYSQLSVNVDDDDDDDSPKRATVFYPYYCGFLCGGGC